MDPSLSGSVVVIKSDSESSLSIHRIRDDRVGPWETNLGTFLVSLLLICAFYLHRLRNMTQMDETKAHERVVLKCLWGCCLLQIWGR